MNMFQEKATRHLFFSFVLIFILALLLNLWISFGEQQAARQMMLAHDQQIASTLLKEQVPRDVAARVLTGGQATPEGIHLLAQLGIEDSAFSLSSYTSFPASTFSFSGSRFLLPSLLSLLLVFALLFASVFRFLLWRERLYQNAIPVISAYTEGQFDQQLPQSCEGTIYRLFTSVNHMASVLKSRQESDCQTKEFLKNTISDISHQLKTPLAALSMYNEILLEEPDHEETVRTFVRKSDAAIERMRSLIFALLKIARLDSGSIAFQKRVCSVSELLRDASEPLLMRAAQEQKEICLPPLTSESVLCDPAWTAEALSNLLKNALDHSSQGQRIQILFQQTALETQIQILDNGSGIPPEDLHHIFKRFYRSQTSMDAPGIGLGLPLAKAIAEGQGGRIEVESILGEGSVFTLSLPSFGSLQNCKAEFTSL